MSTAAVTFSEAAVREVAELAANHAECIVYQVDRAVDVELITDRFICHCYIEPGLQLRPPRHTSFGSPIRGFRRRARVMRRASSSFICSARIGGRPAATAALPKSALVSNALLVSA